jgi:coenzyme PQQ synthesis protein D (PqqD)
MNVAFSYSPIESRTNMKAISFQDKIRIPDQVLVSGLQVESVLLNLDSERYFGLDEVGTRMLTLLNSSDSIESAYNALLEEYDVDEELLKQDLTAIIEQMVDKGLVEVTS